MRVCGGEVKGRPVLLPIMIQAVQLIAYHNLPNNSVHYRRLMYT